MWDLDLETRETSTANKNIGTKSWDFAYLRDKLIADVQKLSLNGIGVPKTLTKQYSSVELKKQIYFSQSCEYRENVKYQQL